LLFIDQLIGVELVEERVAIAACYRRAKRQSADSDFGHVWRARARTWLHLVAGRDVWGLALSGSSAASRGLARISLTFLLGTVNFTASHPD
jgi:hypothetical protein